jgi:outer membrane biosynthesis protein TonB
MEPQTDLRTLRRRRISIAITVLIHVALIILICLPLLDRMDLVEFGNPNTEADGFSVQVSEGTLGSLSAAKPNKPSTIASNVEEVEETQAKAARPQPVATSNRPSTPEESVTSDTREEPMVAPLPAEEKKEEERKEEEPVLDLTDVFGHDKPSSSKPVGEEVSTLGSPDAVAIGVMQEGVTLDGLSGRVATFIPPVEGRIPENGTVVVHICVDRFGEVTRADYTQVGTTTGTYLKQLAEENACDWKFSSSNRLLQCGKIIFDFQVR